MSAKERGDNTLMHHIIDAEKKLNERERSKTDQSIERLRRISEKKSNPPTEEKENEEDEKDRNKP